MSCEPRDRARRVVGVERREDEVAGERGLDRDLGRLEVADLADQDHVGVLADDVPEPVAKVRPIFGLTAIWLTPFSWYSTGSSTVMILRSGELILSSAP